MPAILVLLPSFPLSLYEFFVPYIQNTLKPNMVTPIKNLEITGSTTEVPPLSCF